MAQLDAIDWICEEICMLCGNRNLLAIQESSDSTNNFFQRVSLVKGIIGIILGNVPSLSGVGGY